MMYINKLGGTFTASPQKKPINFHPQQRDSAASAKNKFVSAAIAARQRPLADQNALSVTGVNVSATHDNKVDIAMAKRNNLMNEIENNLQKADNFNQVIQPTGKLKRDENEALQYMQHQRAQTQAELEMQKRLKMMEEIEANPEKGDKFNRIVKPSDL